MPEKTTYFLILSKKMAKYVWNSEKAQDYGEDCFVFHNLKIKPRCFVLAQEKSYALSRMVEFSTYIQPFSFRYSSNLRRNGRVLYAWSRLIWTGEKWWKVQKNINQTYQVRSNIDYDPQNPESIGLAQPVKIF